MGQRAYRGKYTDSLVRDYINKKENVLEEQYFFSGKPKDVRYIFDLDDPLKDVDVNSMNLNRGLLNCIIPKNTKINNLNLILRSKIFGQKISYLHSNLYCLFGTHFIKDISYINISIYNPETDLLFNERRLIKDILDFMCFKTIKLVNINKNLMYYVIPENSEFAIVLAFKEINYEEKHTNFLLNLEDLIFHPYSKFIDSEKNLKRCLGAIDKTIPKNVTNLIMPIIIINLPSLEEILRNKMLNNKYLNMISNRENQNEKETKFENYPCEKKLLFHNFNNFLNEIKTRGFKVISFELNISLQNLDDYTVSEEILENSKENKQNHEFDLNFSINDLKNKISDEKNRQNSNFVQDEEEYTEENNPNSDEIKKKPLSKKICCCLNKITKKNVDDEKIQKYSEQYVKIVDIFLEENLDLLKRFQQVFISFDFDFNDKYNIENSCCHRNEFIAYHFKKMIIKKDLENVTLIHHTTFTKRNEQTSLEDQFDYLDYVFFNRELSDELYKKLFIFKKSIALSKISRKKNVMNKILSEFLFDFRSDLFREGRFDYSYQILRNSKIIPMQINSNSSMIFLNN